VRRKSGLAFDLLHDRGNEVARRFGLVHVLPPDLREVYKQFEIDLARLNGDDSWTLPMPARYVIDSASIIQAADVNPDYTLRPEPSQTVAIVKRLQAS
jgi:peroxiredoxin